MEISKEFLIDLSGETACRGKSCPDCPLYIPHGCMAMSSFSQDDFIKNPDVVYDEVSVYAKQMIKTYNRLEIWKNLK